MSVVAFAILAPVVCASPFLWLIARDERRRRERDAWRAFLIPTSPDLRDVAAMALWEVRRRLR